MITVEGIGGAQGRIIENMAGDVKCAWIIHNRLLSEKISYLNSNIIVRSRTEFTLLFCTRASFLWNNI